MSKFMMRAAALAAFTSVALALCVLPSSSAQSESYSNPLVIEDPIVCEGNFFGRVDGGSAPYTLAYVLNAVPGPGQAIDLGSFPLAAAGPYEAPAGFVTGVPDGTYNVNITLTDDNGSVATTSFTGTTTAACPRPPVVVGSGGGSRPIAGPSTALIVTTPAAAVPVAVTAAPEQPLAYTGSNIDMPVLIGFSLVGLGGLALLEARKRQSPTASKR